MNTKTTFDPEKYGKPPRLIDNEQRDFLDELTALAATAEIQLPGLDDARDRVSRSREIMQQLRSHREKPEDAAARIAAALVAGDVDLDEAAADLAKVEAMAPDSLLDSAVRRTARGIPAAAFTSLCAGLDGDDVLEQARTSASTARTEIVGLRKTLADVRDAEQANAMGPKAAAAWSNYQTRLLPRWEAAHKVVDRLRDQHLIAPLPLAVRRASRWGRFDLMEADVTAARQGKTPILILLDPISDSWGPTGPHTEAEAERFCDAVERADAEADRREAEIDARLRFGPRKQAVKAHAV